MKSESESYRNAGVDITAGYESVRLMKQFVDRTRTAGVSSDIGDFGGAFMMDPSIKEPVLISGTDGVGTKLKIAFLTDRHDTVGIDCVAMCVNDVICSGARPLFFLDYIACGKNVPEKTAQIVKGVAEGCVQAGAALIGGETAEMPGFYPENEYDLAGFAVGVAEKAELLDKKSVQAGDIMIALPSSGVHSNGFSLVRKVLDVEHTFDHYSEVLGMTIGECLLTPTKIYVKDIQKLSGLKVRSLAHITGGGFYENIPRSLPENRTVRIKKKEVRTPEIFRMIAEEGNISERDMFNTFNMGVGMTVTVAKEEADEVLFRIPEAYVLGEITEGTEGVILE